MKKPSSWRVVYISGWVVSLVGILNMVWDFSTRVNSNHFDLGLVRANIALVLMGLFATAIAKSLHGPGRENRTDRRAWQASRVQRLKTPANLKITPTFSVRGVSSKHSAMLFDSAMLFG